jgi:DNA-binding response OmpR family regulator
MGCYRDLHGMWRWEFRDADGQMRDSQHSFDSLDECDEEANRARVKLGLLSSSDTHKIPAGPQHRRTLLCAQPDRESQLAIQQVLPAYAIVFASSGYEAVRHLNGQVFDAYITDQWLPGWSGIDLCREVRKSDPQAPVCFYSSASSEECKRRALRAGASLYLRKPDDIEALREQIQMVLERADIRSLNARLAEQDAIQNELARRVAAAAARVDRAKLMTAQATRRMAQAQAVKAFIESGGTRANFERWWPQIFATATKDI